MTDARAKASPEMPYTPKAPPPPIWHASIRTPQCRHGHLQIDVRDSTMIAETRVDGHRWQTCRMCRPHTHAFGIISRYHRLITYYAITREQLELALTWPDEMDTIEILHHFGYHHEAA